MSNYMLAKNPYQGAYKKALFVCTGGILRSATAAHVAASEKGWNTRSCGIMDESIPPVHPNLLEWADTIYCLEAHHRDFINAEFNGKYAGKITVLGIRDNYEYRNDELKQLVREKLTGE